MNFPLLHYNGTRRERIVLSQRQGLCFGWGLKELSRKTAVYGNQKRKWCKPEYKEATQPPGKGAEPAPARSHVLLQMSCTEPAESNPNYPKISLLPGWISLIHHCFTLIVVLHSLAKLWPPCTVIWHLHQRMMLWGIVRDLEDHPGWAPSTAEPHLLKASFTNRTTSIRNGADSPASQYSCWEAVPSLTTWLETFI